MFKYWLFLIISVMLEIVGTTTMKLSQKSWPVIGMVVMYTLICLSYYSLSKAVIKVPVGVAYAFWEGIGLVLITLISVMFLGEHFGILRGVAIGMILAGTYLVHMGTESLAEPESKGGR